MHGRTDFVGYLINFRLKIQDGYCKTAKIAVLYLSCFSNTCAPRRSWEEIAPRAEGAPGESSVPQRRMVNNHDRGQNLTKRYGANIALDKVSFTVEEGTIVGFLGPNGAGKSTTMNIITGYLSATSVR